MQKTVLLFLFSCISLSLWAQFTVGNYSKTFQDPARSNRSIPCQIFYPSNATASDSFPVIVFGHGFTMDYSAYRNWWEYLVPRGYIMVFPTTEGSIFPAPNHGNFGGDLAFLIGAMQQEAQLSTSAIYQKARNKTVLMGHSMGGGCSFLGAANRSNLAGVVGLAPAETNPSAVQAAASVNVPVLVLSGSSDRVTPPNDHHRPIYNAVPSTSCKSFVNITNGSHCYFANTNTFCDLGETSPGSMSRSTQQQLSYAIVYPWLEFQLKGDCAMLDTFHQRLAVETNVQAQHSCLPGGLPSLSQQGNTLSTNSPTLSDYRWYRNDTLISGANADVYTPLQSGDYRVEITDSLGCPRRSAALSFSLPTGIQSLSQSAKIYVANGQIYVSRLNADYQVFLINNLGQLLWQAQGSGDGQWPVVDLPKGIYQLVLKAEGAAPMIWRFGN